MTDKGKENFDDELVLSYLTKGEILPAGVYNLSKNFKFPPGISYTGGIAIINFSYEQ